MVKSSTLGLIGGIIGIIACFIPASMWFIKLTNSNLGYYWESVTVFWYWLFQWGAGSSTYPGQSPRTGFYVVVPPNPIPVILGIALLSLSIAVLIIAIVSKTSSVSGGGNRKLLIAFGILLMILPWIQYVMIVLGGQYFIFMMGENTDFTAGGFIPIPIGTLFFLVSGILVTIGGAKARRY